MIHDEPSRQPPRPTLDTPDPGNPSDDGVAQLLRSIAPSPPIPDTVRQRARQAAWDTWQDVVATRRRRRRWAGGGLLAASIAGLLMLSRGWDSPTTTELARVEAVVGPVTWSALEDPGTSTWLEPGDAIATPHRVRTGADSRLALRLAGGHALRIDLDSEIELLGKNHIALHRGALYVDSEPAGSRTAPAIAPLRVDTPYGIARDIGTQFEVRLEPDQMRVRVREGRVEIDSPQTDHRLEAVAGAELTVSNRGLLHRRAIEPHGPEWGWNLAIAPTFALEGSTLAEFLHWLGRETGWRIDFVDPAIAHQARTIVLHGDLEGIAIEQTPAFVLATCGLRHELQDATLWIDHQP